MNESNNRLKMAKKIEVKYPDPALFTEVMDKIFSVKDALFIQKDKEAEARKKLSSVQGQRYNLEIQLEKAYKDLEQFRK